MRFSRRPFEPCARGRHPTLVARESSVDDPLPSTFPPPLAKPTASPEPTPARGSASSAVARARAPARPETPARPVTPTGSDHADHADHADDVAGDADDVARARGGDVAAFERLYRGHVGRVYALCRRMCGNAPEAEEMAQEAFVRAWERLDSFRGESAFGSWLHRLTVNVVLGSWRAAGRYRERVVAVDSYDEQADGSGRGRPALAGLVIDLERAIARLPRGARTVFVLHDVEGWGHRDIAEHLGMARNTSKTQLHRARRLLRDFLSSPCPMPPIERAREGETESTPT